MNPASWILLILILLLFAAALIYCIRRGSRCSCGGDCCKGCDGSKGCAKCCKKSGKRK
ncbi:MAG: hypothetical protein ACI3XN_02110 [Eubacteriales bacterium]|nr:hypothetical protein [Clostridiales bacterium]